MTWTHNQCAVCWDKAHPDGRVAVQVRDAQPEACCFCGATTTAGIYVRHDPRTLTCTHPDEEKFLAAEQSAFEARCAEAKEPGGREMWT